MSEPALQLFCVLFRGHTHTALESCPETAQVVESATVRHLCHVVGTGTYEFYGTAKTDVDDEVDNAMPCDCLHPLV